MTWHQVRLNRPTFILLGITLLVASGLGCVFYYTYLNIQHDMALISARQKNVFDAFYLRAKILKVENLINYVEQHKAPGNASSLIERDADSLYGYDLKKPGYFADASLQSPAANILDTFRYALSYPEVINIYTLWNDYRLIGISPSGQSRSAITEQGTALPDLMTLAPWYHYFGCISFTSSHTLCSQDEAFVSEIEINSTNLRNTIVMYFPFLHRAEDEDGFRYGLLALDIAVDDAFADVLYPIELVSPTRTSISFNAVQSCPPFFMCLKKPFMRTKAGTSLYLTWSYSWTDFTKLALHSAAFKIYLIALLLIATLWKQLYKRLRALATVDPLTRLPRREILSSAMLHEHDYLMILDIDNFKSINDTYGHGIGDQALIAFANHLKGNTRKLDNAIRWGGEEFIVLFKGVEDDEMMRHSAARLLNHPLTLAELPNPITFSAGMVRIRDNQSVAEAVHLADALLYHVKHHGKNNIACYNGPHIALVRPSATEAAI